MSPRDLTLRQAQGNGELVEPIAGSHELSSHGGESRDPAVKPRDDSIN